MGDEVKKIGEWFKTIYGIYKKHDGVPVLKFKDVKVAENIPKRKSLGYRARQYWDAKDYMACPNIEAINKVLLRFRERAKTVNEPNWYVKGACLYFTFSEEFYEIGCTSIDSTPEIFDVLSSELEDALYEVGAYDMAYIGLID